MLVPRKKLSSRPERTRISCNAAPPVAACAAFRKVVHRRCRPAGYETGHFSSGRKCNKSPGAPSFALFCEGWDTTNLDTDRRVSHPLQRAQRMGHPPFVVLPAMQSTNGGFIENLFLIRKPHEVRQRHAARQEIRGSAVEGLGFLAIKVGSALRFSKRLASQYSKEWGRACRYGLHLANMGWTSPCPKDPGTR
jgi:hypothetical protein